MSVVLPAPVGPTMATVSPGSTAHEKSWMTVLPGTYPKRTWSKETRPARRSGSFAAPSAGSSSSGAPRNSNTRSAAAVMLCSMFDTFESCWMGWVKLRTYWMKLWMSPGVACPFTASAAPTATTPT